jgi:hypothetical protein
MVLFTWRVYWFNQTVNCVNLETLLNLMCSNLGGSKQSRFLRALNQEDALYIFSVFMFDFISKYGMVCTPWLALKLYQSWRVTVSLQHTCLVNNMAAGPLLHIILGTWALPLITLMFWFWCSVNTLVQRRPVGDAFQNGKVCTKSNVDLGSE